MSQPKPLLAEHVREALRALHDPARALGSARFFKTGKGQYGEGDRFLGVTVPAQRTVARAHRGLPLPEIEALLASAIHEERLTALFLLVDAYAGGDDTMKRACFDLYLRNLAWVNNWDLVDASAEYVLGAFLLDRPRGILDELAASPVLWERRVAVLATFAFLKAGDASTTLVLAARLLDDPEDLMHKAVGWMLRETGKRVDRALLLGFLDEHAARMPRTMLAYATEHLDAATRAAYRSVPRRS